MGGGGSTEQVHHYHTNTVYQVPEETKVKLQELETKVEEFEAEAVKQGDPNLYTENVQKQMDSYIEKLPDMKLTSFIDKKPGEKHYGVLGNISAGKSSLMNTLFQLEEQVSLDHCTSVCKVVHSRRVDSGVIHYWDVPGSNQDCKFYKPENLSFVKDLDKVFIVYCDDIAMISNIIRVVNAINPNIVLIRTKCDQHNARNVKTVKEVKESDCAKAAEYCTGYKLYAVSAHHIDAGYHEVFDWFDVVDEFK
jgi:small GTP-binding protein